MNRRIRKKLHVGEFNWRGFEVSCVFEPPLSDTAKFLDDYLAFCDTNNLATGGGVEAKEFEQFVTKVVRGRRFGVRYHWRNTHATEADRALVVDYLQRQGGRKVSVGRLVGAWFSSSPGCHEVSE